MNGLGPPRTLGVELGTSDVVQGRLRHTPQTLDAVSSSEERLVSHHGLEYQVFVGFEVLRLQE